MLNSHLFKMLFTLHFIVICLLPCLLLFNQTSGFASNTDKDINLKMAKNELQTAVLDEMIQVYVLANTTNNKCRIASKEYSTALKNYEPWALKMLDASSKLPTGIAGGNMADYGAYTQCVQITNAGPASNINGKHCLLAVLPSETLIKKMLLERSIAEKTYQDVRMLYLNKLFEWTICVPDACQPEDVFTHFKHAVDELFDGLNVTLQPDIHCSTWAEVNEPYTHTEQIVLGMIGVLCAVVLISTAVDVYKHNKNIERGYEVIFSLVANSRWLIAERKSNKQLACVDGIRVINMLFVIITHRFVMKIFYAPINHFDMAEWVVQTTSQVCLSALVLVDAFFLQSGCLLSYRFLHNRDKKEKFNYTVDLLHHYLRLAPSFGLLILITVVFGQRFGSGIKWAQTVEVLIQPCRNYWWSALLNIQSVVNPTSVCFLQTWYLTSDMIHFALAPLLMFSLIRSTRLGLFTMGMIVTAVAAANFQEVVNHNWRSSSTLNKDTLTSPFFAEFYIAPHLRVSPYIIGLGLGYILYKYPKSEVRMRPLLVTIGWICSLGVLVSVVWANCVLLSADHAYNTLEVGTFYALHRNGWALGMGWIVWACANGYGGPINTLLSGRTFSLLAKLSYSAFLIHVPFQFFMSGDEKVPHYFSTLTVIYHGIGDFGISYFLGYLLSMCIEFPIYRLSLYLVRGQDINTI